MTDQFTYLDASKNKYIGSFFRNKKPLTNKEVVDLLNGGNDNDFNNTENDSTNSRNEKQYTKEEILEILNEITDDYFQHYKHGKMNFHELTIIENILIKFQWEILGETE